MKIALLGMGTIGSGVYEMLAGHPDISVKRILDRRALPGAAEALRTERMEDIMTDGEIDTVVELLGGVEPAHSFALAALHAGKNLVSANKLMLSHDFSALLRAARAGGGQLRVSASVGGGIPWLPNLLRARRVAKIAEIGGIVNGTTNYILDAMQREGMDYGEALALAQRAGFAEADPSADVDGLDARSKLALSACVAFNGIVDPDQIDTCGIRGLSRRDVAHFQARRLVCRLIAWAKSDQAGMSAWVEPTLVSRESPEAAVLRNDNCITFISASSGRQSFIGQGAGKLPTAYTVVNDLTDLLLGAPAPDYVTEFRPLIVDNDLARRRYYVRADAPLPFPAEALGENAYLTGEVSVKSMHDAMRSLRRIDPNAFFAGLNEA